MSDPIRWWLPLLITTLAGCSLAPKFEQPAVQTPDAYKRAAIDLPVEERGSWKPAEPAERDPRGEWWKAFKDPVLDRLVTEAVADSPSLQAAAARVKQSRALLGVTEADRGVAVTAGFGPFNTRPSPGSLGLPPGTGVASRTLWRAPLTVSYELDLFGRVKDNVKAAKSDLRGAEATYRSVTLALQADVARTYFQLREIDADIAILVGTIKLREDAVRLLRSRFEAGAISELDLARARTETASARTLLEADKGRRAQLENALAVLVGKPPAAFGIDAGEPVRFAPGVPPGVPSALLERRPDIVRAQTALIAANARIGVAKAAFFPSIRLTGQGGFESDELGNLFRWSSRTWFLGPFLGGLVSLPILDGGRNKANLARSKADYEEAVGNYRQQVLLAFGDVEDSLAGLRSLAGQEAANAEALDAITRASKISRLRYDAGAVNFLDVIDAERSRLDIARDSNRIVSARVQGTVALIRALGGGWGDEPVVAPEKVSVK